MVLFERSSHHVALSSAGAELLPAARGDMTPSSKDRAFGLAGAAHHRGCRLNNDDHQLCRERLGLETKSPVGLLRNHGNNATVRRTCWA